MTEFFRQRWTGAPRAVRKMDLQAAVMTGLMDRLYQNIGARVHPLSITHRIQHRLWTHASSSSYCPIYDEQRTYLS